MAGGRRRSGSGRGGYARAWRDAAGRSDGWTPVPGGNVARDVPPEPERGAARRRLQARLHCPLHAGLQGAAQAAAFCVAQTTRLDTKRAVNKQ